MNYRYEDGMSIVRFQELGLPNEITEGLTTLRLFVDEPIQFLDEGRSFSEIIEEIGKSIEQCGESIPDFPPNVEIKGPCWIHPSAKICSGSVIIGPCIIGADCKIGPTAYLRPGTVLGQHVYVGFGTEVKESVIGRDSKIIHRAYVGNSLIGKSCEISAGVVISAQRFDERPIRTWKENGKPLQTSLTKLGAIVGDNTKLGSGAIILPGARIGEHCRIWPNSVVSGFIQASSEVKHIRLNKPQQVLENDTRNLIERFKIIAEAMDRENDRFWTRNTVFVTISAALLALFAGYGESMGARASLYLALFGLVVSLAWVQVIRMGKYYWTRIYLDAKNLIEPQPDLADSLASWTDKKRGVRPWGPRATRSVQIVAIFTVILWLMIGLSLLFGDLAS